MIAKLPPPLPVSPPSGPRIGEALAESWRQIEPAAKARSANAEALQDAAGVGRAPSRRSLRQTIMDMAKPEGIDPALLQNSRSLDLLGHVVDALLPGLDMDPETRRIAELMIEEEIAARIDLDQRRQDMPE